MKSMYLGSGDVSSLMAGLNTEAHQKLLRRFVSGIKPFYNAKASPIDALRTGAILEERYLLTLSDSYFYQYVVQSEDMNVFKCSLDFAKLDKGKVIDFDELKTIFFNDFLDLMPIKDCSDKEKEEYVIKKFKNYYRQIQEQLYCTGLESANIVFLAVYSYDDDVNYTRDIEENDYFKIRIHRNEDVIASIKKQGLIFQQIKDIYT